MSKICPSCDEERKDSDFLKDNECYKCVFARKVKREGRMGGPCRICGAPCGEHRWVYCSKECSTVGEMKQKKEYWTAKVPYL